MCLLHPGHQPGFLGGAEVRVAQRILHCNVPSYLWKVREILNYQRTGCSGQGILRTDGWRRLVDKAMALNFGSPRPSA